MDWDCVNAAYESYKIAVKAAMETFTINMTLAAVGFAACIGACAVAVIYPGVGWFATLACAAICVVLLAAAVWACHAQLNSSIAAAAAQLKLDLAACGVTIVED